MMYSSICSVVSFGLYVRSGVWCRVKSVRGAERPCAIEATCAPGRGLLLSGTTTLSSIVEHGGRESSDFVDVGSPFYSREIRERPCAPKLRRMVDVDVVLMREKEITRSVPEKTCS
jgi:hypothetical protein